MIKTSLHLKIPALLVAMFASNMAMAGSCANTKAKELAVYGTAKDSCAGVRTTADMTKNPYTYTSPNAGCDLGLDLPGLPGFGGGGGGISACSIARAITGPMVSEVNTGMQSAANAGVRAAEVAVGKENIDAAVNVGRSGGDLGAIGGVAYERAGSPTSIEGVKRATGSQ